MWIRSNWWYGCLHCAEKKEVPYCIIKGKSRLGQIVHKKFASCVALTSVRKEDQHDLDLLAKNFNAQFNDNADLRRRWGGGIMGIKSQHITQRRERAIQAEQAKKMGLQTCADVGVVVSWVLNPSM